MRGGRCWAVGAAGLSALFSCSMPHGWHHTQHLHTDGSVNGACTTLAHATHQGDEQGPAVIGLSSSSLGGAGPSCCLFVGQVARRIPRGRAKRAARQCRAIVLCVWVRAHPACWSAVAAACSKHNTLNRCCIPTHLGLLKGWGHEAHRAKESMEDSMSSTAGQERRHESRQSGGAGRQAYKISDCTWPLPIVKIHSSRFLKRADRRCNNSSTPRPRWRCMLPADVHTSSLFAAVSFLEVCAQVLPAAVGFPPPPSAHMKAS